MINGYSGSSLRLIALALLGSVSLLWHSQLLAAESKSGKELVNEHCADCHKAVDGGGLGRISEARRTPEGWDMTVARMTLIHGTKLTSAERQAIVKYLSDTMGLAPEEAQPWRYALDHRPEAADFLENKLVGETCARCHSYARIALQRRTQEDWLRLSHFHVGQFTTVELQSNLRSVNWWEIASKEIPKLLVKHYPLNSEAWKKWQEQPKMNPAGSWRIAGHRPGWGDYEGTLTVTEKQVDEYAVNLELRYAGGKAQKGTGNAIVYTGYEWRGTVTQGDEAVQQVFTLSEGGNRLQGRWFIKDTDALGGELRGAKVGGKAEILAVTPGFVKAGEKQQITISGVGLSGDVSVDGGVSVSRVVSSSPDKLVVEVQTTAASAKGLHAVQVGATTAKDALNVYQQIDFVRVVPDPGLSRVGGSGGKIPLVPIQFEAVAYSAGDDGKSGTKDDVRIGVVAAQWSLDNLNAAAAAMKDLRFAGTIDAVSGLFTPGAAGPNKQRKFGTNNFGELKATATVEDGKRKVKGSAPFIVTAQRWNDPPIR
jgi:quinohemoprotein amine dehydrogenase